MKIGSPWTRSGRCRRLVRRPEGKGFPPALMGDFHRPVFREQGFAVARVALVENPWLPVTDVGFGKVSKQTRFLDTFLVHVRAFVCLHDLIGLSIGAR